MATPYSNVYTNAFVVLLSICCLPTYTTAAKILAFFPEVLDSQLYIHCRMADVLASVGHNVTVIAPSSNPILGSRYHYIPVALPDEKYCDLPMIELADYNSLWHHMAVLQFNLQLVDLMLEQPVMKRWFVHAKRDDFDLLILSYQANDFHIGLATLYNCSVILSTTTKPTLDLHQLVGNPYELRYVPTEFLPIPQNKMSSMDSYMNIWKILWYQTFVLPARESRIKKYYCKHFPCQETTLAAARDKIALVFTNHHFSQSLIRPNVPAIVEIGGIHITDYKQKPSEAILTHINQAENGFIYVNLGSAYNCTDVPRKLTNILFDYFTAQRIFVVWRWTHCIMPRKSPFIYYQRWLDQTALLSDPNLRAFITHGGENSLTEGIYHNAPMLAITHTPEQAANVEYLEAQGALQHIKGDEVDIFKFQFKLYNLLHDPSFKKVCQTISEKYRDRPQTPRQTLLYWVNYVLRYRGAVHLRSPAADMYYFQRIGLDFIVATVAILFALYFASVQIRKWFRQPIFIRKTYDYVIAPGYDDFRKFDISKYYQVPLANSELATGEDTAGEETEGEETESKETAGEEMAGEETAAEDTEGEETESEETESKETAGEEMAGEETAGEETECEETAGEEMAGEDMAGEETASEETVVERTASEETAGEETAGEEMAGEETVGERTTSEETVGERTTSEETLVERTTSEETAGEETLGELTASEETTSEKTAAEETASEETADEETVGERTTSEETAGEETTGEETLGERTASEETTSEKTAAEETASEEAPMEESPGPAMQKYQPRQSRRQRGGKKSKR